MKLPMLSLPLSCLLLSSSLEAATGPVKLLVVAPQSFADVLQPLIAHKNLTGMPARLVTLESLVAGFPGTDDPEKLKRGIADAHEKLGAQ